MTAAIAFNPYITTVGNNGLFNVQSTGGRQGTAYPDPSNIYRLRGGLLANSETIPMWGGVAIYANVPGGAGNPSYALGTIVGRAVSLNDSLKPLAGFSTYDQAYGMVTSPQSPAPLIGSYGHVNWYPLGSLARIWVQCDPSLTSERGGPIAANVAWDYTNQLLVPYIGTLTISSGTYNSTTGLVSLVMSAPVTFSAGDSIGIASLTGTGTNLASLNGTYTAASAAGTAVTYQAATGLGSITITGGSLTVGGLASQALPCKVLDLQASGCETVAWNAATTFATWNFAGSAALIQS